MDSALYRVLILIVLENGGDEGLKVFVITLWVLCIEYLGEWQEGFGSETTLKGCLTECLLDGGAPFGHELMPLLQAAALLCSMQPAA